MSSTTPYLDLVFCVDCTGSMGGYIKQAQDNIKKIVEDIVAAEKVDVQFALVSYRDHPPQETTYVVQTSAWTSSAKKMKEFVDKMDAVGGGDAPEAVVDSLEAARNLEYRKNSTRVCVLIADAPPHALGEPGDGFDKRCPCGHDPLKVARLMEEQDIKIYAVAVEPALGSSMFGRDFMMALAQITDGQCIPLTNAALLTKAIVGSAVEEISLARHHKAIAERVAQLRGENPDWTEDKALDAATEQLGAAIQTNQVDFGELYANYNMANVEILKASESLKAARKVGLKTGLNSHISQSFQKSKHPIELCRAKKEKYLMEAASEPIQSVEWSSKAVSRAQVARVWEKSKKKASRGE